MIAFLSGEEYRHSLLKTFQKAPVKPLNFESRHAVLKKSGPIKLTMRSQGKKIVKIIEYSVNNLIRKMAEIILLNFKRIKLQLKSE